MITYCKNRLEVLISAGVRPILVFDGGALNMKAGTDKKRRERREECLGKALALQKKKKNGEAHKMF
jgi:exonuclease-1